MPSAVRLASVLTLLAALAVAGCGAEKPAPPAPELPAALADELAGGKEEVAALVEAGDFEGARTRADALRQKVVAAINAGEVPPELAEPLLAEVNELAESIPPPG